MRTYIWLGLSALLVLCSACGFFGDERVDGVMQRIGDADIYVVEAGPMDSPWPTVLFLHGASYNADIWVDLGITEALGESQIRSVAIDLPGFGSSSTTTRERAVFLADAVAAVDVGRGVVVVSPSMSGAFSLALIAAGQQDTIEGLVAVAPVGVPDFLSSTRGPVDLPVYVYWGENDGVIDPNQAQRLAAAFVSAEVEILSDAGHAPYEDSPDRFATDLVDFVQSLPET